LLAFFCCMLPWVLVGCDPVAADQQLGSINSGIQ